jgi:two-component system, cell cycle sensor histidine kinase and response regulator CckA
MTKRPSNEELEQRIKELEKEAGACRQAEDALRHEKTRLESLIQQSALAIVTLDEKHNIVSCNHCFEELFQFKESDIARKNLDEVIAGRRYVKDAATHTKKTLAGSAIHGSGKRYRKDGTLIDVEFHGIPVVVDGKIAGAYGIYQDISERTRAEKALQESEVRYRSLVENTMGGYFVCKIPSGRFLFLNQRSCDLFGYTMKEGLDLTIWDVTAAEDQRRIRERIQARLEGKLLSSEHQTYTAVGKDGSHFRVEISTSSVTFQGMPCIQGVIRDITEQERLEQQLQQGQKMEAIGTLAAGIAHDFNNLLMGIQGRASLMLMSKDSSHSDIEHLRGIEDYVKSAADLTRQLLGFARGGKYEVKSTNLNNLLKKSSGMFGRTKKEITIHSKFQEDLWAVEADPGQIEQVLLNLYVNAWHAMPGGGKLYLETENVMIDEHYSKPYHMEPGKYVKISVTDAGSGMDEATRKRIFDPFFTTREMGRGTGLGLASVYGIIKSHRGFIDVYSEKDHGTTFKIYLPAMEAKSMAQRAEVDEGLKMARGIETILLVDDEDMIIDVGTKLLGEMGYHVLIAKSGREAIEIVSEANRAEPISSAPDLVILDMIMPDMGGGETYDKLKKICPGVRVLLSSGYSIDGQATEILERGCNGFIQKPFNIVELSQKLREIMDKR